MAKIIPDSDVRLYKDVEITDGHQLCFSSKANQTAYFVSKQVLDKADFSYVKKNGKIRVGYRPNVVAKCNYISFKNTSFENKTFYARIVNWEYVNNETTDIFYQLDEWQSYMFDVKYETSKIVREHVSEADFQKLEENPWDRSVYEMWTDEGLASSSELLSMIKQSEITHFNTGNLYILMIVASRNEDEWGELLLKNADTVLYSNGLGETKNNEIIPESEQELGNFFKRTTLRQPVDYIMFSRHSVFDEVNRTSKLQNVIDYLTVNNSTQDIIGLYMVPANILYAWLNHSYDTVTTDKEKLKVINKKLCWAPFNFLELHTHESISEYQYENFYENPTFEYIPMFDTIPMMSIVPINYGAVPVTEVNPRIYNSNKRLDIKSIPQMPYQSDSYLSFLGSQYQTLFSKRDVEINSSMIDASRGIAGDVTSLYADTPGFNISRSGIGDELVRLKEAMSVLIGSVVSPGSSYKEFAPKAASALEYSEAENKNTINGEFVSNVYGRARQVYTSHIYQAGDGVTLPYYTGLLSSGISAEEEPSPFDFALVHRHIEDEIIKKYDDFFSQYGYASNRIGIPRVCNYVSGKGAQPHFQDGITYIKTEGMTVISNRKETSDYISAMFNGGVKMKKGD